ncbi:MAG: cyclic nucleotide-binding domain-containing protein [Candidatus Thiodiazotropha sp.]
MQQQSRVQMLQEMPIFGGVMASTLETLLAGAEVVEVDSGGTLFKEGDLDNSVYVLEKGRVGIYRVWQGHEYKLRELGAGDCLGEMALIDCKPRSATVRALEPCTAIRISVAQMGQLYASSPEYHALIYMNLAREVCRRLRVADHRLFVSEVEGGEGASGMTGHE